MKVTELMIGDWVYDKINAQNIKIVQMYLIPEWCDNFIPIPLTSEILKKNGWIFEEGQDYSSFPTPDEWNHQNVTFALRVYGKSYHIDRHFDVAYVHELQHALRLCGLNELADNFKL